MKLYFVLLPIRVCVCSVHITYILHILVSCLLSSFLLASSPTWSPFHRKNIQKSKQTHTPSRSHFEMPWHSEDTKYFDKRNENLNDRECICYSIRDMEESKARERNCNNSNKRCIITSAQRINENVLDKYVVDAVRCSLAVCCRIHNNGL